MVVVAARDWRETLGEARPVQADELPGVLGDVVRYMRPLGAMFPEDWLEMMALTCWSSAWPEARVENLPLNLWFLGVNPQGVGKNITSDELYRLFVGLADARGQALTVFTSGSAEGMGRRLAGEHRTLLAYHREYAGFLKSLKMMPAAKEMLCNLYDGADVAHVLANETIEAHNPYAVVVATTTPAALMQNGQREDLTNGYLSRFLFCAPDSLDVGPEYFRTEEERDRMVIELTRHCARLGHVRTVDLPNTPELTEYQTALGIGTGRRRDLDAERHDERTPPGRLVARAKKVAALLALAAGRTTGTPGDMALAIRVTERADAYSRRVGRWIGVNKEDAVQVKVKNHLARRGPMTQRDLRQYTHEEYVRLGPALQALMDDGLVRQDKIGKKVVYRLANGNSS